RQVHHRHGVALAEVADPEDLAVADVPHGAVEVADRSHPQPHGLHGAGGFTQVHDVADTVLVLDEHEHAGQEVPHEVLRAERHGHTDHTRGGQHRAHLHTQHLQHVDQRPPVD